LNQQLAANHELSALSLVRTIGVLQNFQLFPGIPSLLEHSVLLSHRMQSFIPSPTFLHALATMPGLYPAIFPLICTLAARGNSDTDLILAKSLPPTPELAREELAVLHLALFALRRPDVIRGFVTDGCAPFTPGCSQPRRRRTIPTFACVANS
jgi:hypothetical protein